MKSPESPWSDFETPKTPGNCFYISGAPLKPLKSLRSTLKPHETHWNGLNRPEPFLKPRKSHLNFTQASLKHCKSPRKLSESPEMLRNALKPLYSSLKIKISFSEISEIYSQTPENSLEGSRYIRKRYEISLELSKTSWNCSKILKSPFQNLRILYMETTWSALNLYEIYCYVLRCLMGRQLQ